MTEILNQIEHQPAVLVASEFDSLLAIKARAARLAGSVVLNETVVLDDQQPYHSLLEGIKKAAQGDNLAYQLVKANVASDVIERTIKAGFITPKIHLDINQDGSLSQYGQSYLSIQANSLLHSKHHEVMRSRTEAEARNAFRLEEMARRHSFEDYSLAVFSRAEDLAEYGFFTDTMSCAIQLTAKDDQGVATESAFVAGIDSQKKPHDEQAVIELYKLLAGVDISGLSPAEIIDRPLLIPNSLIPNGVIDLVKLYDLVSGDKFFGLDKPKQDYLSYKQHCLRRENDYLDTSLKIIRQLIAESDRLKTPLDASQRLHQLSEQYTLEMTVYNHSIDPRVFGRVAAAHLIEARLAMEHGIASRATSELTKAIKTANSSSCPSAYRRKNNDSKDGLKDIASGEDEHGSLSFVCPNGHTNIRQPHKLIAACQHKGCRAKVKC